LQTFPLPVAVGAALAAPDRQVIALVGDGSAMYTLQALWTMAREKLDVTVIILANRSYNVLCIEPAKVGVDWPGRVATEMLSLNDPALDWVALSKGHGVLATSVQTLEDLATVSKFALATKGPYLIDAVA
jgi:acetolactate synthase I/II/III large subunit